MQLNTTPPPKSFPFVDDGKRRPKEMPWRSDRRRSRRRNGRRRGCCCCLVTRIHWLLTAGRQEEEEEGGDRYANQYRRSVSRLNLNPPSLHPPHCAGLCLCLIYVAFVVVRGRRLSFVSDEAAFLSIRADQHFPLSLLTHPILPPPSRQPVYFLSLPFIRTSLSNHHNHGGGRNTTYSPREEERGAPSSV